MSQNVYKVLFVCLGNICRSPSAENIMRHLVSEAGLADRIKCDSAGTSSYHIGSAPDRRMNEAARRRGLTLVGSARQFERIDFESFDRIVAMDRSNYRDILMLDRAGHFNDKVVMMCDYCCNYDLKEVPDPYYGGEEGFNRVIDLLFDACEGLLADIKTQLD